MKPSQPAETALVQIPAIEDLLSRMTLPEKLGQMTQHPHGIGDPDEVVAAVRHGKIGSFLNARDLDVRNRLQRVALEESRLRIPLIFGRDVIHGYKTIFPIPLGQGATFNPDLVERAAAAAAAEAAEDGIDWTFAPMVDIARDPRWGRIAESLGEDPHLASRLGAAMVRGFQGSDPRQMGRVAACAKHFVGYGASESGKDYNTTLIPEQLLREVHLAPFEACVKAGVLTLMSGFNDLNGVPASANELTMRRILKQEWGFGGFVVSDWASTSEMIQHGFCEDGRHVALEALRGGVDMEMAARNYLDHVAGLIEQGLLSIELVDDAVRRILYVKHALGLFDDPYVQQPRTSVILGEAHRQIAREAAQQSIVLLKNDGDLLPLAKDLRKLAVVGPLADDAKNQLGCWAYDGSTEKAVTLLAALRARLGGSTDLRYARGLESCRSKNESEIEAAVEVVHEAEVALVVLGEDANISGECRSRAFLDLPGAQMTLLERLAATGTPLVLILMAGRPLVIGAPCSLARAVLYAWHPGTMAGPGLADVLLGEVAPSGKLPVSFPRTVGQIPIYYGTKNTGRPPKTEFRGIPEGTPLDPVDFDSSYLDVEVSPQFPFGFGLSYSTFAYSEVGVSPERAPVGASVVVTARVTNTGKRAAAEVVQLYVRDLVGSVTRPIRELKGFERVWLEPGEAREVRFTLTGDELAFPGRDMRKVVEAGRFQVFVGGDSRAPLGGEFELT